MYRVLIVDDKKTIRDGLKKHVDWQELGFQVAGDFPSAANAMEFLEHENADVLLTDIVMPDMTGLQLIREVNLINPTIKVVILSAYERFEYAQQAIRLGAFSYLTKPVNLEKLKAEFSDIRRLLDKASLEKSERKEAGGFAKEQFLSDLVTGFYASDDSALNRAREIGLVIPEGSFLVIRAFIGSFSNNENKAGDDGLRRSKSIAAETLGKFLDSLGTAYVFKNNPSEVSAIIFPISPENIKQEMVRLKEALGAVLDGELLIGVGKAYGRISCACDSYHEAGMALQYHIVDWCSTIHLFDEVEKTFKGRLLITPAVEETILGHMLSQNEGLLLEYVMGIIDHANKIEQHDSGLLYDACIELILVINKYMAMNVLARKSIEQDDYHTIKNLLQKKHFTEIRQYMAEYLKQRLALLRSNEEKSSGLIIENAKLYIREHYREELSLNRISKVVYVNPTYLSRLFKEKVGENFIDYLSSIRIEQAKKLLEDLSLRVCDIAEMVGYESRKHFGKTFKDLTGLSPREYRDRMAAGRASDVREDQPESMGM